MAQDKMRVSKMALNEESEQIIMVVEEAQVRENVKPGEDEEEESKSDIESTGPPPLQRAQARQISRVGALAIAGIGGPPLPADESCAADTTGTDTDGESANNNTPLPSALNVTATLVTDDEYEAELRRVIMRTSVRASKVEAVHDEEPAEKSCKLSAWLSMVVVGAFLTIGLVALISLMVPGVYDDGSSEALLGREEALVAFLKERSFDGGKKLRKYTSPQRTALRFIASEFPNVRMDEYLIDIYALATFFFSTGGTVNWGNYTKWKSGDSVCIWHGIGCDDYGHVVSIELKGNGLGGSIPQELGMLVPRGPTKGITTLDLSNNYIGGNLPEQLGFLESMEKFIVEDNILTGQIPEAFANWTSVKNISVARNELIGEVPHQWCALATTMISVDCKTVTCHCCAPSCVPGIGQIGEGNG